MDKTHEVFQSVLKEITPGREEEKENRKMTAEMLGRIRRQVPACVEVRLMGSVAKGTDLKGKRDFDVFMLFPKAYSHHEMSMLGLHYARKAVGRDEWTIGYAEHPYLRALVKGHRIDIVPCYKIASIKEKGSSVDRSQLHTQYVNRRMTDAQRGDVRLLKQFMKALGVYGAELRVEGFSGYLCELLVLHYCSLEKLMKAAASEWDRPVIDIEKHHKADLREIFDAPLIVIDPVDEKRNVAAVVSQTSLNRFIFACRQFLKKPNRSFFFPKKKVQKADVLRKLIKERKTKLIAICFSAPKVVEDVLWPQLKKTSLSIRRVLQALEFEVFGCYHWSDGKQCVILLELSEDRLPAVKEVIGPSVKFSKDVDEFVREHRNALNVHIEHDKIVAVEHRGTMNAEEAVKKILKQPERHGIPENFHVLVKRSKFLSLNALLGKEYIEFVSDYFTRSVV